MEGWIQYSMSPTTAAWLAQHFYWQWKYSMDKKFLEQRCRPYFDAVEKYLSKILITDTIGKQYRLPLSSSPEYNDNSIQTWFPNFTNYNLSLIKNLNREYSDILSKVPYGNPEKIVENIISSFGYQSNRPYNCTQPKFGSVSQAPCTSDGGLPNGTA